MVYRFAVIGNPIEHSLSPQIHQQFALQCNLSLSYEKQQGNDTDFEAQVLDFFQYGGQGMNVTLPFKQRAFTMAETVSERCSRAGAANTLMIKDSKLYADNTDGVGLIRDLSRLTTLQNKHILILGAGGAARGIIYPLLGLKPASLTLVNRTMAKAAELQTEFPQINIASLASLHDPIDLIINATSASLEGNALIVPEIIMALQPFCYDLAYNRTELTPFVRYARNLGCEATDGLGMLVEQAAEAFHLWHGLMPRTEAVLQCLRQN